MVASPTDGRFRVDWLLPGAITALALLVRLWNLGGQSIWYDEAFSLLLARHDFAGIAARTARDIHPPLYYWLLHLWGEGLWIDVHPRLLSTLAGTVSVPLVFAIGRRLFDSPTAAAAALLTAVAPFQVFYGQEVRMYALLGLWNLMASYGLIAAWQRGTKWGWPLFTTGIVLALYTHPLGWAPPIALLTGIVLTAPGRRALLRPALVSVAAAGFAFLPWAAVLAAQSGAVLGSFWAAPPTAVNAAASPYLFFMGPFAGAGLFPLAIAAVLLTLALSLPAALRRHPDATALRALWCWIGLPLLGLLALSLVRPVYLERVVFGSSFAAYLLMGWSVARLPVRALGLMLAALLTMAAVVGLRNWYGDPAFAKPPQREAAAAAVARWQPGEPVLHTGHGSYLAFRLYAPQMPNRLLAGDPEENQPTTRANATRQTLDVISVPAPEAVAAARRFLVVVALDGSIEFQRSLVSALDARYQRVDGQQIGGIQILEYEIR